MDGSGEQPLSDEPLLAPARARLHAAPVGRIRRVYYVYDGAPDRDYGPIELMLADGRFLVFDAGPDGEALVGRTEEWDDPFGEPLSTANREFVREHGKWTAYDVSAEPPYAALVGHPLEDCVPHHTHGKLTGLTLTTGAGRLHIHVIADELQVTG